MPVDGWDEKQGSLHLANLGKRIEPREAMDHIVQGLWSLSRARYSVSRKVSSSHSKHIHSSSILNAYLLNIIFGKQSPSGPASLFKWIDYFIKRALLRFRRAMIIGRVEVCNPL